MKKVVQISDFFPSCTTFTNTFCLLIHFSNNLLLVLFSEVGGLDALVVQEGFARACHGDDAGLEDVGVV